MQNMSSVRLHFLFKPVLGFLVSFSWPSSFTNCIKETGYLIVCCRKAERDTNEIPECCLNQNCNVINVDFFPTSLVRFENSKLQFWLLLWTISGWEILVRDEKCFKCYCLLFWYDNIDFFLVMSFIILSITDIAFLLDLGLHHKLTNYAHILRQQIHRKVRMNLKFCTNW